MATTRTKTLTVQGNAIALKRTKLADYLNLTDIARSREAENPDDLVRDWLKNRNTVEYLGIWETLQNPKFDTSEFDAIRAKAGLNSFALSPRQWILRTGAIGLIAVTAAETGTMGLEDQTGMMGINACPGGAGECTPTTGQRVRFVPIP